MRLTLHSTQVFRLAKTISVGWTTFFCPWADRARNSNPRDDCSPGYTLLEMLVALAIVLVLAAVCVPAYSRYVQKLRETAAIEQIHAMEISIESYQLLNGNLPPDLAAVGLAGRWDRWGNPYQYLRIEDSDDAKGKGNGKGKQRRDRNMNPVNTDYDLYSMGADGQTATQFNSQKGRDDIVRANDGEYVGLASEH